ncbi:MAG: hypothetical protein HYZ54_04220, partial [Ignavibacteriae bacterium]|nr:hypothetical protein [Ignavibacteriota bacterium]
MEEGDYQLAVRGYKVLFNSQEKGNKISFHLLDILLKKYPDHPLLNNFLVVKYLLLEEKRKAALIIEDNLTRFPDFSLSFLLKQLFEEEAHTFLYLTDPYLAYPKTEEILTHQWMPYKGALTLTEFLLELSLQLHKGIVSEKLKAAGETFKMMTKVAIEKDGKDHWLLERAFS